MGDPHAASDRAPLTADEATAAVVDLLRASAPVNTTADATPTPPCCWNSGHVDQASPELLARLARTDAARARLDAVLRDLGVPAAAIPGVIDSLHAAVAAEASTLPNASALDRFEALARNAHRATFGGRPAR